MDDRRASEVKKLGRATLLVIVMLRFRAAPRAAPFSLSANDGIREGRDSVRTDMEDGEKKKTKGGEREEKKKGKKGCVMRCGRPPGFLSCPQTFHVTHLVVAAPSS